MPEAVAFPDVRAIKSRPKADESFCAVLSKPITHVTLAEGLLCLLGRGGGCQGHRSSGKREDTSFKKHVVVWAIGLGFYGVI